MTHRERFHRVFTFRPVRSGDGLRMFGGVDKFVPGRGPEALRGHLPELKAGTDKDGYIPVPPITASRRTSHLARRNGIWRYFMRDSADIPVQKRRNR